MKQKYYVELNRQEWQLIIEGLNRFRNKLIAAGRYTDSMVCCRWNCSRAKTAN